MMAAGRSVPRPAERHLAAVRRRERRLLVMVVVRGLQPSTRTSASQRQRRLPRTAQCCRLALLSALEEGCRSARPKVGAGDVAAFGALQFLQEEILFV